KRGANGWSVSWDQGRPIIARTNAFGFRPSSAPDCRISKWSFSEAAALFDRVVVACDERAASDGVPQGDINVGLPRLGFLIDTDHGLILPGSRPVQTRCRPFKDVSRHSLSLRTMGTSVDPAHLFPLRPVGGA